MAHCCALRCLTELEGPRIAENCCSPRKAFSALNLACCEKMSSRKWRWKEDVPPGVRVPSSETAHECERKTEGARVKVAGGKWTKGRVSSRRQRRTSSAFSSFEQHNRGILTVLCWLSCTAVSSLTGQRDHLTHQKLQGKGLEGCH